MNLFRLCGIHLVEPEMLCVFASAVVYFQYADVYVQWFIHIYLLNMVLLLSIVKYGISHFSDDSNLRWNFNWF